LGNVRLSYSDTDLNGAIDPNTEIISEKNYYPFGLLHRGYNNVINGVDNNYKQYQGQEWHEDLGLNLHEWKYRFSDPAIGRFISIDPLAEEYSYQSPYNFAENRVIDGNELEGLEWENFMSGFKKAQNLPLQLPSDDAQKQNYRVTTTGNTQSLDNIKSSFKSNPGSILNSSAATFTQIDGNGDKVQNGTISEGSFIKIDIDGPLNNSIVKVIGSEESDNGFSYTFGTLEGHVEKGVITFGVTANEDGSTTFSIDSSSEQNNGTIDFFGLGNTTRTIQKNSWKEVLSNFVNFSGGTESSRSLRVDGASESATDVNGQNRRRRESMNQPDRVTRFGEN